MHDLWKLLDPEVAVLLSPEQVDNIITVDDNRCTSMIRLNLDRLIKLPY